MTTAAGAIAVLTGLGFGLPGIGALHHYARTGQVWTFLGFPTYGGGPFDRIGLHTTMGLLIAFLLVCATEVALGSMLIIGTPHATVLSYALLPIEFFFWIGFALPVGLVLGIARTLLLLAAR